MSSAENKKSAVPRVTPARLIAAVCLIVPIVAVLGVPIYNTRAPEVAGFPFFFWWQLLWVVIAAVLLGVAYFVVRREESAHWPSPGEIRPQSAMPDADWGAGE